MAGWKNLRLLKGNHGVIRVDTKNVVWQVQRRAWQQMADILLKCHTCRLLTMCGLLSCSWALFYLSWQTIELQWSQYHIVIITICLKKSIAKRKTHICLGIHYTRPGTIVIVPHCYCIGDLLFYCCLDSFHIFNIHLFYSPRSWYKKPNILKWLFE